MTESKTPWYNKASLIGVLLFILPLVALVGLKLNTILDQKQKVFLALAAIVNFLGQSSIVVLFLVRE